MNYFTAMAFHRTYCPETTANKLSAEGKHHEANEILRNTPDAEAQFPARNQGPRDNSFPYQGGFRGD